MRVVLLVQPGLGDGAVAVLHDTVRPAAQRQLQHVTLLVAAEDELLEEGAGGDDVGEVDV